MNDTLTGTSTSEALTANQGKVLNDFSTKIQKNIDYLTEHSLPIPLGNAGLNNYDNIIDLNTMIVFDHRCVSSSNYFISLPIAFPNTMLNCSAIEGSVSAWLANNVYFSCGVDISKSTKTQIHVAAVQFGYTPGTTTMYSKIGYPVIAWFAIGY